MFHPCDIPDSEACENFKCPTWLSRQPWPAGTEECRTYLRDKRSGSLTTGAELLRQKELEAQQAERTKREAEARAEEARARAEQDRLNALLSKQQAEGKDKLDKLNRNKKLLITAGVTLIILGLGAVALKTFSA